MSPEKIREEYRRGNLTLAGARNALGEWLVISTMTPAEMFGNETGLISAIGRKKKPQPFRFARCTHNKIKFGEHCAWTWCENYRGNCATHEFWSEHAHELSCTRKESSATNDSH